MLITQNGKNLKILYFNKIFAVFLCDINYSKLYRNLRNLSKTYRHFAVFLLQKLNSFFFFHTWFNFLWYNLRNLFQIYLRFFWDFSFEESSFDRKFFYIETIFCLMLGSTRYKANCKCDASQYWVQSTLYMWCFTVPGTKHTVNVMLHSTGYKADCKCDASQYQVQSIL